MNQKINWKRIILIMGLALTLGIIQALFAFQTILSYDFASLMSLLMKKAVFETLIGGLLLVVIAKNTTMDDIKSIFSDIRPHLVMATLLFAAGIAAGILLQDALNQILETAFEELMREADYIRSIPAYQQALFIFGNNTRVAVISGIWAVFPPALGILWPVVVMGMNGTVIGVAPAFFDMGWSDFVLAILPHGILEVPALILASAVGIKFSISALKACIAYILPPPTVSGRDAFVTEMKPGWRAVKLFAVIIPLLVIAALIEVYISPQVMDLLGI